jgi:hypothetical protein
MSFAVGLTYTTIDSVFANRPSTPVQNGPAVMSHHHRFVIQTGGDGVAGHHRRFQPPTGGDEPSSPPVCIMNRR